jgi:hypothetical protein
MRRVVDYNHVIDGEVWELVLRIEAINILTEVWCSFATECRNERRRLPALGVQSD